MVKQRTIKFRIICKRNNRDLYGEGRFIWEIDSDDMKFIKAEPKDYIFREFTGLKDKNGLTEIYEGDILKDDHNQIHEIKWVQKEGNLKALMLDKDWVDRYRHFKDIQFMEIIGNIYDDKRIN